MSDILKPGDSLHAGQELTSPNGRYHLVMQGDGNLVLYQPEGPVWSTDTWKLPELLRPTRLDFQDADRNLRLHNQFNYVGWDAYVGGRGADRLVLQDDRNVVAYRPDNTPVWDTHTGIPVPGPQPATEIMHRERAEVGWAKTMTTEATLFRDGTLMASTKSECGAPFSGLKGTVLVVAIDSRSRVIWASQTLRCQTACSILDPTCASFNTTQFQEKWPELIGQLAVRIDIFQAENVIYDRFRAAIRQALEQITEIRSVLWTWIA